MEAGTEISRPTVQRYLVDMDDKGQLEYDGNNIITEYIRRITTQNIVRLPLADRMVQPAPFAALTEYDSAKAKPQDKRTKERS